MRWASHCVIFVAVLLLIVNQSHAKLSEGVFYDNFDDGIDSLWWLYDGEPPKRNREPLWSVSDGKLKQSGSGDHINGLVQDLYLSDQRIEVDVSTSGYGGIVLWYQDSFNYVSIFVYPYSSGLSVREFADGEVIGVDYSFRTSHDTWYNLRVDANGSTGAFEVYIDDVYLFFYQTSVTFCKGLSGVTSGNAGAMFDNFKLSSDEIVVVPLSGSVVLVGIGITCVAGMKQRHAKRS